MYFYRSIQNDIQLYNVLLFNGNSLFLFLLLFSSNFLDTEDLVFVATTLQWCDDIAKIKVGKIAATRAVQDHGFSLKVAVYGLKYNIKSSF